MKRRKSSGFKNIFYFVTLLLLTASGSLLFPRFISDSKYASGWWLLGSLFLLAIIILRKNLHGLPLGVVSGWQKFHNYFGVASSLAFVLHAGTSVPSLKLPLFLWWLYIVITITGVITAVLFRYIPKRLTACDENVIYERIPARYQTYRERAEEIVLASVSAPSESKMVKIYIDRIFPFLSRPKSQCRYMFGATNCCQPLVDNLKNMEKEINAGEAELVNQLIPLVKSKDELDYQLANQRLLKFAALFHVPLAYGFFIFVAAHIIVVYEVRLG